MATYPDTPPTKDIEFKVDMVSGLTLSHSGVMVKWQTSTQQESTTVSVCVNVWVCLNMSTLSAGCAAARADVNVEAGKHTHMLKVFVTLLTLCFSVLLLPWKHGSHGNKRCRFFGVGGGGGSFDEIGVFS